GQAGDQREGTPSPVHSSANQGQRSAPRAATSGQAQAAAPTTGASPAQSQGAADAITTAADAWANSRKRRWARPRLIFQRKSFWMQASARAPCSFPAELAANTAERNGSERDGRD